MILICSSSYPASSTHILGRPMFAHPLKFGCPCKEMQGTYQCLCGSCMPFLSIRWMGTNFQFSLKLYLRLSYLGFPELGPKTKDHMVWNFGTVLHIAWLSTMVESVDIGSWCQSAMWVVDALPEAWITERLIILGTLTAPKLSTDFSLQQSPALSLTLCPFTLIPTRKKKILAYFSPYNFGLWNSDTAPPAFHPRSAMRHCAWLCHAELNGNTDPLLPIIQEP